MKKYIFYLLINILMIQAFSACSQKYPESPSTSNGSRTRIPPIQWEKVKSEDLINKLDTEPNNRQAIISELEQRKKKGEIDLNTLPLEKLDILIKGVNKIDSLEHLGLNKEKKKEWFERELNKLQSEPEPKKKDLVFELEKQIAAKELDINSLDFAQIGMILKNSENPNSLKALGVSDENKKKWLDSLINRLNPSSVDKTEISLELEKQIAANELDINSLTPDQIGIILKNSKKPNPIKALGVSEENKKKWLNSLSKEESDIYEPSQEWLDISIDMLKDPLRSEKEKEGIFNKLKVKMDTGEIDPNELDIEQLLALNKESAKKNIDNEGLKKALIERCIRKGNVTYLEYIIYSFEKYKIDPIFIINEYAKTLLPLTYKSAEGKINLQKLEVLLNEYYSAYSGTVDKGHLFSALQNEIKERTDRLLLLLYPSSPKDLLDTVKAFAPDESVRERLQKLLSAISPKWIREIFVIQKDENENNILHILCAQKIDHTLFGIVGDLIKKIKEAKPRLNPEAIKQLIELKNKDNENCLDLAKKAPFYNQYAKDDLVKMLEEEIK